MIELIVKPDTIELPEHDGITPDHYPMSVIISDEILQASRLTPSEFRQEIALQASWSGRSRSLGTENYRFAGYFG